MVSVDSDNDPPSRRFSRDQILHAALVERERLLEHHPHLRAFQTEIDRVLDKSGNQEGRLAVLAMLIQVKLLEMQKELTNLSEALKRTLKMQ